MTDIYRVLGRLYISSIKPLEAEEDLKEKEGITSIVNVQKEPLPSLYDKYSRLQVPIDDVVEENLFLYFGQVNEFIEQGLKDKGKVLVVSKEGESRSVSFVVAYLMKKFHLVYKQAVYAVQRRYPEGAKAEPNEGFAFQLQMYSKCGCCDDEKEMDTKYPQYRAFKTSLLKIEDMTNDETYKEEKDVKRTDGKCEYSLRCRHCGQVLATSEAVVPHTPPTDDSKQKYFYKTTFWTKEVVGVEKAKDVCTHYFLEPVTWMKPELSKGELVGRFDCFKCGSKVGGYLWQGSRCSCGRWMTPAIHLQKAKVIKEEYKPLTIQVDSRRMT